MVLQMVALAIREGHEFIMNSHQRLGMREWLSLGLLMMSKASRLLACLRNTGRIVLCLRSIRDAGENCIFWH
jgi:hypothetical protein